MADPQLESYEQVPYESHPLLPAHPATLASVATLFGMTPPAIEGARVLELGCAGGGNLIPMAVALPCTRFVGIDLSPRQIETGRTVVRALGLDNVELRAASILDVGAGDGVFDYVVCHGVWSWVPAEVQDKILDVCARNLAPDGIAYVSYNTYPGWHMRGMVRDMMQFHARRFEDPHERVQQARALLDFMAEAVPAEGPYGSFLREEAGLLRDAPDSYLFHEHLEDVNHPVYFHQFVDRLAAHGLQWVAEAIPTAPKPGEFTPEVEATLRRMASNAIHLEQYLDFLRIRGFRRSLLCHAGLRVERQPSAERLATLRVASAARAAGDQPDVRASGTVRFTGLDGRTLATSHPILKAALLVLGERWPEPMALDALGAAVRARLGGEPAADDVAGLAEAMLECWISGFAEAHPWPPSFRIDPGERPLASPLARLQAASSARVASLAHRLVELDELDRRVLGLLDGSRDRAALLDALARQVAAGDLVLHRDGAALAPAECGEELLGVALGQSVYRLGRSALLVG